MEIHRFVVKMKKKDDVYNLRPISDPHIGSPLHDSDAFNDTIDYIEKEPCALTMIMGDVGEQNSLTSRGGFNKHFDIEQVAKMGMDSFFSVQIKKAVDLLQPIAPKIIGAHLGNHDDRSEAPHVGFQTNFCQPLGIRYLGDLAYTILTFTFKGSVVREFLILSTHGTGISGQTPGAAMNSAFKKFGAYDFDVALFGHTHFAEVSKFKTLGIDTIAETPQIVEKKKFICNTGSFVKSHLDGFDSYTDKKFGSLRDVGTITVTFEPYTGKTFAHA